VAVRGATRVGADRAEAARILRAVELFAVTGHGDVKSLKGEFKGQYCLRAGKWRVFFELETTGALVVTDVDNRGQAN
jgi:mRNA-degrading endonuclease RelE of RelBE toxin-antitoxin system